MNLNTVDLLQCECCSTRTLSTVPVGIPRAHAAGGLPRRVSATATRGPARSIPARKRQAGYPLVGMDRAALVLVADLSVPGHGADDELAAFVSSLQSRAQDCAPLCS